MARKPRNPAARSPLLRKGGVHRKSRSSERMRSKRKLKDELGETGQDPTAKGAGADQTALLAP